MTRYITLAEYFWLAEQVTGTNATVLAKASRSDLADSALHAPMAGFGDEDFYPDIHDKAAVRRVGLLGIIRSQMGVPASRWPRVRGRVATIMFGGRFRGRVSGARGGCRDFGRRVRGRVAEASSLMVSPHRYPEHDGALGQP